MEIAQDKIDLIGKIIKNDRKYPNNEDLYEDFLNETCKRSAAIIDTIGSESTLEIYLRRVVATSIINVLKDSGRLRRTRSGYMSTKELSFEEQNPSDYSNITISYSDVKIPQTPEDIVIQKELLEFVADTIKQIDEENPEKEYLNIYTMRYDKGMTQKEIASQTGLSQSEISKRLYKLMEKIRLVIE